MADNRRCEFCGDLAFRILDSQETCVDCFERLKDVPQAGRQNRLTRSLTWLLDFYSEQVPKGAEQAMRVRDLTRRLARDVEPPEPISVAPVQHTITKSKALKIRKRF